MVSVRTAQRRVGGQSPRQAPPEPPAAAVALPPRRSTHIRDAVVLGAAGLAGCGAAPLLGHPDLGLPVLAAGLSVGTITGASGALTRHRHLLEDRVLEALAPTLGVRHLDRRLLKLSGWTLGWPGHPRRVRIQYAPGAPDQDPAWQPEIIRVLSSRLGCQYKVARHDHRRCRIWLVLVATPRQQEASAPPHSQVRAEKAIRELIGATVKIIDVDRDGDLLHSITVSHEAGAKLAASGYRARVEKVISTMMPGRWRAIWDLEADTVRFEVRPTLPTSIWLPNECPTDVDDLLKNYRQVKIGVGHDEDGHEVFWYPARTPQAMIIGGTGSGKTSTDQGLLAKITQHGWPVWVLDAKRVEFLGYRDWPNVQIVAGAVPQQVALIRAAWELMEYRYQLIEDGKASVNDFEPLVVFLEEFAEFRSNLLEWYAQIKVKGDPTRPPTLAEVASLVRKARTARIHLVISTQRPDVEFLGGEMRDNLGFRISLGRLSPQGAMMTWENPAVGVALPRGLTGRAIASNEAGDPVEVQCYRTPDPDAEPGTEEYELLKAIRPKQARWPRLVICPPDPHEDSDGNQTPPTFRDYAHAHWDLASNRPDLDPLAQSSIQDRAAGRQLASTLASLGIHDPDQLRPSDPWLDSEPTETLRPHLRVVEPTEPDPTSDQPAAADGHRPDLDDYAGYAEPSPSAVHEITVGDLIEVEEGSGIWAVIDEAPEEDISAPGMVALSWRGDDDSAGVLSVPNDNQIAIRRPLEEAYT